MLKYLFILFPLVSLGQVDEKFLRTLGSIESNNNDSAIGDGGKAIGRYQIWESYYRDAREFDNKIKFPYVALTNKENSDMVVKAYLNRYAKGKSPVSMARVHNGGPLGDKKAATVQYGKKFQKEFDRN